MDTHKTRAGHLGLPLFYENASYLHCTKAERQQLSHRYDKLKNEVKEVEQIRRNVYGILKEEKDREQPTRKQDMEL